MKKGDVIEIFTFSKRPKISIKFRIDPVPYSGKSFSGHIFRKIETTQERKWNVAHKKYVRGKRRKLPNSWDDFLISSNEDRSWKNCTKKKKQWM